MSDKPTVDEKQRHAIITLLNAGEDRQVVAELLNLERELRPWLESGDGPVSANGSGK